MLGKTKIIGMMIMGLGGLLGDSLVNDTDDWWKPNKRMKNEKDIQTLVEWVAWLGWAWSGRPGRWLLEGMRWTDIFWWVVCGAVVMELRIFYGKKYNYSYKRTE